MNNEMDAGLLVVLQKGLPISERPFAVIGERLGLSEATLLARVRGLFESGVARRFGAVFESRSLGYLSTLCAADVPVGDLAAVAARITPHPGITHCYERDGHPNLWFTMTAPRDELAQELERVAAMLGSYELLNFPALQKFKIEAVFGQKAGTSLDPRLGGGGVGSSPAHLSPLPPLSEREKQVVRRLQGNIAVSEDPFSLVAADLKMAPAELLDLLRQWETMGVFRRIGLVLRHRQLGFFANSMCVWKVAAGRIQMAGNRLAQSPYVTHCYERPALAAFPYNLYAMIHAKSREEAIRVFKQLGHEAGVSKGRMLWSVREFKKSSPVFFGARKGLLFAVPGTTCAEARGVFGRITEAAIRHLPGVEVWWAYTSAPIRRKLAAQDVEANEPGAALQAMQAEGISQTAVVPLHLTDGKEFRELSEIVVEFSRRPETWMKVSLGHALMMSEQVWLQALAVIMAGLPGTPGVEDRVILVAHGSEEPRAEQTLRMAAQACRKVDPRLRLGMILGKPGREAVVQECREDGVKKVWLIPCMVASGYSAQEEIAGPGEHSWATALRRAGIEVVPVTRGLGDILGIVELWLEQAGDMLGISASTPSLSPEG